MLIACVVAHLRKRSCVVTQGSVSERVLYIPPERGILLTHLRSATRHAIPTGLLTYAPAHLRKKYGRGEGGNHPLRFTMPSKQGQIKAQARCNSCRVGLAGSLMLRGAQMATAHNRSRPLPTNAASVVTLPAPVDYPERRPPGRPDTIGMEPVVIDWELAQAACECTGGLVSTNEVSKMLGVSRPTLNKHCKRIHGCTFATWASQWRLVGTTHMMAALYKHGRKGNASAAKHWLERAHGTVEQKLAVRKGQDPEATVQYVIPANNRDPDLARKPKAARPNGVASPATQLKAGKP